MQTITNDTLESLLGFLHNALNTRGFEKAVLGLSGGIDSAVVAVLCKHAFGEKVKAILMPSLTSSQSSIEDSQHLCLTFHIPYEILPIQDFDRIFCANYPNHTADARGNFCARMRMATLYYISQMEQRLVIGTSNKSEIMLGYGTIFGDLACAVNPIGNLYKTQIYELATLLKIPQNIITKAPSADLYEGQSDEKDLGYSYAQIDKFLESYEECHGDISKLTQYPQDMILALNKRISLNRFKQKLPEIYNF